MKLERQMWFNKMKLEQLNIKDIKPNPFQPREKFLQEELQELADNIKTHGLIQPIVVTKDGKIVAGERRWRASKLAGLEKIYAIVKDYETDSDIKRDSLIENEMRENLTNEEFKAFTFSLAKSLGEPYYKKGWIDVERLSEYVLGLGPRTHDSPFRRKLARWFDVVTKATPKVKKYLDEGKLDLATASQVSNLDKETQDELVEEIKDLSTNEKRQKVSSHNFEQEANAIHEKLKKENSEIKRTASEKMWLNKIESKIVKWKQEIAFANNTLEIANKKSFWGEFSHNSRMSALDSLKPLKREVDKMQHIVTKIMETISDIGGN